MNTDEETMTITKQTFMNMIVKAFMEGEQPRDDRMNINELLDDFLIEIGQTTI